MTRYFRLEKTDDPIPGWLKASGSNREIEKGLIAFRLAYDVVVEITQTEAASIRRQQARADNVTVKAEREQSL